jgi:hypothetical protein
VAVLPFTSVVVIVNVVVPVGKIVGALFVVDNMPQLSAVVGVPILILVALQLPASATPFIVAGQVIVGA